MSEIWVWAEQRNGRLLGVSLELLGKALELAAEIKAEVAAVLLGHNVQGLTQTLIAHGAGKVYLIEDERLKLYQNCAYSRIMSDLIEQHKPEIFMLGGTSIGMDLAPRVAAKVRTGLTAHCVDLQIENMNNSACLVATVPGWGGNLMVKIVCPQQKPQTVTVRPGIMGNLPIKEENRIGQVIRVKAEIRDEEFRTQTLEMVEQTLTGVPLESADVIVAGGWGMKAAGGFKLVEELAGLLQGAVAGTRPAVDEGWIPEEKMLGASGKTVSPKLLISIGSSGQIQFTSGFMNSKAVLAINDNLKAPIFEVCDIGLAGDLKTIVPCLIEELKRTK
ncbi:MAG: electron transfer flavoprotein subunit alpha/FixB family protein [Smithellaceae bacterium]